MTADGAPAARQPVHRRLGGVLSGQRPEDRPASGRRAREHEAAAPLFRALALLNAVHEPMHQVLERNSILFSVNRRAA